MNDKVIKALERLITACWDDESGALLRPPLAEVEAAKATLRRARGIVDAEAEEEPREPSLTEKLAR